MLYDGDDSGRGTRVADRESGDSFSRLQMLLDGDDTDRGCTLVEENGFADDDTIGVKLNLGEHSDTGVIAAGGEYRGVGTYVDDCRGNGEGDTALEFDEVNNCIGLYDEIVRPTLIVLSSKNISSKISKYSQVIRPLPVELFLLLSLMARYVFFKFLNFLSKMSCVKLP